MEVNVEQEEVDKNCLVGRVRALLDMHLRVLVIRWCAHGLQRNRGGQMRLKVRMA